MVRAHYEARQVNEQGQWGVFRIMTSDVMDPKAYLRIGPPTIPLTEESAKRLANKFNVTLAS